MAAQCMSVISRQLLPAHTGVTRCLAQPPRGSTTTTSHQQPLIRAPCATAPAHTFPLVSDHTRVSHTHARPLHPAAFAFVPYGIVLVRVLLSDVAQLAAPAKSTTAPDKPTPRLALVAQPLQGGLGDAGAICAVGGGEVGVGDGVEYDEPLALPRPTPRLPLSRP